jgi:hypothetical protein
VELLLTVTPFEPSSTGAFGDRGFGTESVIESGPATACACEPVASPVSDPAPSEHPSAAAAHPSEIKVAHPVSNLREAIVMSPSFAAESRPAASRDARREEFPCGFRRPFEVPSRTAAPAWRDT